ncbi:protein meaA [Roseobacter sp. HKCCD9010]|uniref:protein meaA n=1 Tax=unclassified Roseobacter TaxID=196798 RepID=UPI001491BD72|nr:protein meaA [Roseobacter sp. HKCCD7357]NNV24641.1 protein meaA [Roseobacter sp. HKCCD8192]NNV33171.1 protein meaA [Roseobacter sp. HKCCD9073]NNV45631.1 protein meaA [Roseobacter sp. HKCCD6265]NNV58700.1 protein meaA [Roseobacter sp. HKCCD8861]NNV62953.1 protein meaA [Roseobacter sp. HKCCD8434]NNV71611.1 protein meaA [Roseobacter sp. HKCCD5932]NNV75861.1 protein meaA [Roseobacter sp. HKCCD6135]NNV84252.1 protein meaA [Roseobacter sp. HKCCD8414]NNV88514.1 protein meaA [Roseobacter sp. HK
MTADKDRPWLIRTYAGHSTAKASNALYRGNLAKGQTGLSVAFDLPTQTGYDSDHELARGEVGKVGVPVSHLGDMRALFDQIPLEQMNTSMTINATAPWLLALYIAVAEEQGADVSKLQGTVQNDLIKEYLSRGTYICPPKPSLKMIADVAEYCYSNVPKWNPMNVCSYHLQEAGATPEQELAFALATATAVLDALRPRVDPADFPALVGRISFFVNAGIRFVTEMCKMRAFVELWDEICKERYGVEDPKYRRFRYGVQVNSLGLTEQQPENNVYRILIEMLAVTLSKNARARAVQLPAWNEALGLPRPWDQQWSMRMQQIMAFETDLLEHGDLFDGNPAVAGKVETLKNGARAELANLESMGGAIAAIDYMKGRLVESNADRVHGIEQGETVVVGVNKYTATEPSPLTEADGGIMVVDPAVEAEQISRLEAWRAERDANAVAEALAALRDAAKSGANVMPPSIAAAKAGVTTGEWAGVMRAVFGEYRGPTGVARSPSNKTEGLDDIRDAVDMVSDRLGRRLKFLVGKPGLDGHSNGAEQIAFRARDCGMDISYEGIRLTPEEIVAAAKIEDAHVIGLSILSGSHVPLIKEVMERLHSEGMSHVPVMVGGIIPDEDVEILLSYGVAKVYTPKDFELNRIMMDIVHLVDAQPIAAE